MLYILSFQLLFIAILFMTVPWSSFATESGSSHQDHRTRISLENTHPFLDEILMQSLSWETVAMGFCAQEEERLLWFTQHCFYLPYCCFRDWLVDEGELGLKCRTGMSGSDNHLWAVYCKFDDGTEVITDR